MDRIIVIGFVAFSMFFNAQSSKKNTKVTCYDLDSVLKIEPSPLYKPHITASKSFTVGLLKTDKIFQKYVNMKRLHKIQKSGTGFRVQNLTHSRQYLNFKSKKMLSKMGEKFYKDTKGSYFTVSSLTRTLEDQCRLRRVNSNASLGISSHNYGNSFDISYVRFNGKLKHHLKLEASLEKVLKYYEKLGRIYFIKEKQQSCYHVTVRNY